MKGLVSVSVHMVSLPVSTPVPAPVPAPALRRPISASVSAHCMKAWVSVSVRILVGKFLVSASTGSFSTETALLYLKTY